MSEPIVKKEDVLNASRGMLQKQLYVYRTWPVKPMSAVMEALEEHLQYQMDLERRGIMFGAGPFWDDNEENWMGEGMVIVRAESLAEARAIAEADPIHKSGIRAFEVRPWLLNEGTVTVKIDYSNGRREIV